MPSSGRAPARNRYGGGCVERHGSETYFVIGEGLLGESVGGREQPWRLAAREASRAAVPLLADGAERGQPPARRAEPQEDSRNAMVAAGGAASQIPAGFTYLGQFVDHDLTFDKTNVMLGENVSPAQLLQARSPSLDLDSLYGAGPTDPGVGEVLRGRRPPPQDGQDGRGRRHPREGRASISRAARARPPTAKRKAIIPDPRNDENLAVAQTHLAFIRFHNRVVDTLPASRAGRAALRQGAREVVTKHYQWMLRTDFLPRICAAGVVERRVRPRAQGVRGRRDARPTSRRCRSSSRSPRSGSGTRWSARLQLEQGLRRRRRHPRPAVRVLADSAATSSASRACRATGSRTSAGSTTSAKPASPTSSCRRPSSTGRCASTRRSSNPLATPPRASAAATRPTSRSAT